MICVWELVLWNWLIRIASKIFSIFDISVKIISDTIYRTINNILYKYEEINILIVSKVWYCYVLHYLYMHTSAQTHPCCVCVDMFRSTKRRKETLKVEIVKKLSLRFDPRLIFFLSLSFVPVFYPSFSFLLSLQLVQHVQLCSLTESFCTRFKPRGKLYFFSFLFFPSIEENNEGKKRGKNGAGAKRGGRYR